MNVIPTCNNKVEITTHGYMTGNVSLPLSRFRNDAGCGLLKAETT